LTTWAAAITGLWSSVHSAMMCGRDAALAHAAETFAGVLVDDQHFLERVPSVVTSKWK
jgi:hypothetical protein